jgi:diketogulonate reductase-like aldo/keto reductase
LITKLNGKTVSPIGIGTWGMGGWFARDARMDKAEISAIQYALDNGINLIDTAELYGRGHAEELVGEAIKGRDRDELFIVSKVSPTHLSRSAIRKSAAQSLKRMQCGYIDLYLVHWPRPFMNMKEIIGTMEELADEGSISSFGVSNFGIKNMEEAIAAAKKHKMIANEIKYSPVTRECEKDVLPFCERKKIAVIAYSPLAKGDVVSSEKIVDVAKKYGMTPAQVSLAYLMRRSLPIPKATTTEHLDEMIGALDFELKDADYEYLKSSL